MSKIQRLIDYYNSGGLKKIDPDEAISLLAMTIDNVKQLEQRLAEAEKVIDKIIEASKNNAVTKFAIHEFSREYLTKYKGASE